jgi:quercetin dioxygenase-like cupin family protein
MEFLPRQPSAKGPAEWFTGDVYIDPIARSQGGSHLNVGAVHFTPGARTAWHSHAGGQTLYVTEGQGLVQSRGDRIAEIRAGDVIYTPHGEEHWHGAAPNHFMTHLSLTEGDAHWGAQVTDADYIAHQQ